MSNEARALAFWEHPDMVQLIEFVCCGCLEIFHLGRRKSNPYPYHVKCVKCDDGIALPTQEKRDWLKKPKKSKNESA